MYSLIILLFCSRHVIQELVATERIYTTELQSIIEVQIMTLPFFRMMMVKERRVKKYLSAVLETSF